MTTSKETFSPDAAQQKKLIPILICLALAILTVAAFWQLRDCGFINMDDGLYVYRNAAVQSGLNANNIKLAFSPELAKLSGHWHPLTWLSWMLDHELFGLNPRGYHLINLLLHLVNTLLLFLVLRRMTKSLWPSAFVAALFAIHPLHVESVAWIAERKDVLSTFFWMLTMGAYSYYVESPGLKRYVFVVLFFVLGLLAKPMLITLPFVLLLLDFWPLRRFQAIKPGDRVQAEVPKLLTSEKQKKKSKTKQITKETLEVQKSAAPEYSRSRIFPLLWEKVPLFALAILSSVITYFAAQSAGAVESTEALSLGVRIGNAFVSYIAYIGKMIWPSNLAIFYPHPLGVILWQVLGSVLLLAAITLAVFWKLRRFPYLATGWLWYLGTLVPVIGIVQAGSQAMADRYTYVSLIGLFMIAAWGVPELLKTWRYRKEILLALSILIILGLSTKTWTQVGYWQNSFTLFDHVLKVTDRNWLAYNNRGTAYKDLGNYRQAIEDFNKAIEIKVNYADAYSNRGAAYKGLGNYGQAIEDYNKAIAIKPDEAMAYSNRGNAYKGLGNYQQAIEDYNRAIEMKPDEAMAYGNRGVAYKGLGNYRQAIEDYNRAIEINPSYVDAYMNRGVAYGILGNYRQAIEDLNKAIEIKPDEAKAYGNRGNAYAGLGHYRQAIEDYNKAIEIKPDYEDAYLNRGAAYAQLGDANLSINDFRMAAKRGSERAKNFLRSQGISW
ncbi:MAG: TPR repeat-containing protein YrrB [Deltaproteobacteria bacterium ADurb.Bin151]|nr:MAG: TPR repeat-containing protein YrrB [Deltaproteobacteria bacterium ADurb.Bin151]